MLISLDDPYLLSYVYRAFAFLIAFACGSMVLFFRKRSGVCPSEKSIIWRGVAPPNHPRERLQKNNVQGIP